MVVVTAAVVVMVAGMVVDTMQTQIKVNKTHMVEDNKTMDMVVAAVEEVDLYHRKDLMLIHRNKVNVRK